MKARVHVLVTRVLPQVALRWVLQLGNALTTATASEEHMVDDMKAWA